MSTMTLLIISVTSIASVFVIALPFLKGRKREWQFNSQDASAAAPEEQFTQLVSAIRDLDFDYDLGKVHEADYVEHRKLLIGRVISIMIRFDEVLAYQDELGQKIEDMVVAYRQ